MNTSNRGIDIAQSDTLTDRASCVSHYWVSTPGSYDCIHDPVRIGESVRIVPGLVEQAGSKVFKRCDPVAAAFYRDRAIVANPAIAPRRVFSIGGSKAIASTLFL